MTMLRRATLTWAVSTLTATCASAHCTEGCIVFFSAIVGVLLINELIYLVRRRQVLDR